MVLRNQKERGIGMGFVVFLLIGMIVLMFIGGYYALGFLEAIHNETKKLRKEIEHERDRCYSSCRCSDKL